MREEKEEASMWQPIETAPKDRSVDILICGGTYVDDTDWLGISHPFNGHALVRFYDGYVIDAGHPWKGEQLAHDEYRFHAPEYWMPLPPAPQVLS